MYRRKWVCVSFLICNLFFYCQKTFAQSHSLIDSLQLNTISQKAYKYLKDTPNEDIGVTLSRLDTLIYWRKQLENYTNINHRLFAHRLQITIDQSLLLLNIRKSHLVSSTHFMNDTLTVRRLLLENENRIGRLHEDKNHEKLESITGISHEWITQHYLFPSPLSETKMIQTLMLSRLHKEPKARLIREIIQEGEPSYLTKIKTCFLIQPNHFPQIHLSGFDPESLSFEQLYQINVLHLLYPYLNDKDFVVNELLELYQIEELQTLNSEQIESIASLSGCWLPQEKSNQLSINQITYLLYAYPFSQEWESAILPILVNQGTALFPYYSGLLSRSNNRLLLSRIIRTLIQISGDKSEIIPLIRAKLFELYFLNKGKFLSSEQLIKEFANMNLQEGGDLMLLLIGDKDQRIREGALRRLAEIGDSYTYRKLRKILVDPEYTYEKKTLKQTENSLQTIYSRIIPPDPLEISLPTPNLEDSKPHQYVVVADSMPQFPGGVEALGKYLQKRAKYIRKHPLEGIVMLRFVVDTNGRPIDVQIVQSLHPLYDQRAIDIVYSMPKWKVGSTKGKPVAVSQHLTIAFRL